jgi:hypothetical protein
LILRSAVKGKEASLEKQQERVVSAGLCGAGYDVALGEVGWWGEARVCACAVCSDHWIATVEKARFEPAAG